MPTQKEVQSLRDALMAASDADFLQITRAANYRLKPSEEPVRVPGGKETFVFNKPLTVDEYLKITGLPVSHMKSRVIADICDNAWAEQDQFFAALSAANLTADADRTVQAIGSIESHTSAIATHTDRTARSVATPWYKDVRWIIGIVLAVIALIVAIWQLWLTPST